MAAELARCGVQVARFESNSAGGTVADSIAKRLVEMGALCSVQKKYTMSNKETRILAASPWVIQNCVFRDVSLYQPGSDYARFMTQLEGFVLDGKNPHDDAPDAMSMLADLLTKQVRPKARAVRRPF
ncbi:phage terminase large subunit [Olsenella phocaeensis]|uniref:phage terminase large subunit n=1 Tax=Olsenella phocaeensis TaxID=1852385 RepID=UPI001F2A7898|nr:phage terminase large subunit [Olsenella phocaeensis]